MELRYYLSTLGRRKGMILMVTLIATLVSIIATLWWIQTTYNSSLYFTVSYRDDQPTTEYKYGNYHANMAAIEFARTLSGWTKNPKLTDEVYLRAGVSQSDDQGLLGRLLGPFSTNRIERANIEITIRSKSAQNAEKLVDALQSVLVDKLDEYNTVSATKYEVNNPSKSYEVKQPKLGVNIPIGIVIGLLLGILIAFLYEYFAGVVTSVTEAEELAGREKTDLISRADGDDAYSFLASVAARYPRRGVIFAGITMNPGRYALHFTRALASRHEGILLVDGNMSRRNLHTFIKGHRKMKKGHTDADTLPALRKLLHPVDSGSFHILPAGRERRYSASLLQQLAVSNKSATVFHTRLPENADLLAALPQAGIFFVVQLGRSKADDVQKLRTFSRDRETYLVIIK